jgi:hypothetical protein
MADQAVLGLYRTPEAAADAVGNLQQAGVADHNYEIMTGVPYPEGTFGEPPVRHKLYVFPFMGAMIGLTLAILEGVGTQLAYPLVTGGKPILSIPPIIIISYELTLLGAIVFTVIGIIFESRLPRPALGVYDTRITEGLIGVVCTCAEERVEEVRGLLQRAAAIEVKVGQG